MERDGDVEEVPCVASTSKQNENRVILSAKRRTSPNLPVPTCFDYRSYLGQFGWHTVVGDLHVPYIFRSETMKCIALRIVNMKIFTKYFKTFKQKLFDMFELNCTVMTEYEKKLYNEINYFHCDYDYGFSSFQNEHLVKLSDVLKLHDFLTFFYNKIVLRQSALHSEFGYMTFDTTENIVPFYKINGEPCFPTIFFEGDDNYLHEHSKKPDPFIESVLKVLMKVQNVKIVVQVMRVITLTEIKIFFPANARYTEGWIFREYNTFTNTSNGTESSLKIVNTELFEDDESQTSNGTETVETPT